MVSATPPEHSQRFADDVNQNGVSYHLLSRQFLNVGTDHGFMVGGHPQPGTSQRTPEVIHEGPLTPAQAEQHIDNAHKTFGTDPTAYAGGWKEDGNSVLDVSTRFEDRGPALLAAHDRGERAVFDSKNIDEIPVPYNRSDVKKHGQRGADARSVFMAKAARGDYVKR